MDNTFFVVGAISSILGIVSFFLPIKTTKARVFHAVYVLIGAVVISFATYQSLQIARMNDVALDADQLFADFEMKYTQRGFVHAALAFMEKNQDLYPDAYSRARMMCTSFGCDQPGNESEMITLAFTLKGMVRGLGTMAR